MKVLPFTSQELSMYLTGWKYGFKEKPEWLYDKYPELLLIKNDIWFIQKKNNKAHEFLNDGTALLFRHNIKLLCAKLNIHPIVLGFENILSDSSSRFPYLGTEYNPFSCKIVLDLQSYPKSLMDLFVKKLESLGKSIFEMRISDNSSYSLKFEVIDIQDIDYKDKLNSLIDVLYAQDGSLKKGIKSVDAMNEEPQMVHAWRSKPLNKSLLKAAAAGSLAHKGELYLRWLDSKKFPDKVVPIDEDVVEHSWPGAINFFKSWAALGIEDREQLKMTLKQINSDKITLLDNSEFTNFN